MVEHVGDGHWDLLAVEYLRYLSPKCLRTVSGSVKWFGYHWCRCCVAQSIGGVYYEPSTAYTCVWIAVFLDPPPYPSPVHVFPCSRVSHYTPLPPNIAHTPKEH